MRYFTAMDLSLQVVAVFGGKNIGHLTATRTLTQLAMNSCRTL